MYLWIIFSFLRFLTVWWMRSAWVQTKSLISSMAYWSSMCACAIVSELSWFWKFKGLDWLFGGYGTLYILYLAWLCKCLILSEANYLFFCDTLFSWFSFSCGVCLPLFQYGFLFLDSWWFKKGNTFTSCLLSVFVKANTAKFKLNLSL